MDDGGELRGILAMMPAFTTDGGTSLTAEDTVDEERLANGVDRTIRDGIDLIATTGSFGEGYGITDKEFTRLVRATVSAADGRVPVLAGCVGAGARAILARARAARDIGADGLLVGLPNYFPLTVENAVRFYADLATELAGTKILLYHNPLLFRTRLPVDAVIKLLRHDNIVGLKDSHRDPRSLIELADRAGSRLSVFVATSQYLVYSDYGVAGTWSYECWMDPWPVVQLRDAVRAGDRARAIVLTRLMTSPYEGPQPPDVRWRETAAKLSVRAAGYCDPGPMRFPYAEVPPEVTQRAAARATAWLSIRDQVTLSDDL